MDFLKANTTNHRRLLMFIAAGLLGLIIIFSLNQELYGFIFALRAPFESGILGLIVFEVMFRTRKWLTLKTVVVYLAGAILFGQIYYGLLYGSILQLPQAVVQTFSTFPFNVIALFEPAFQTGLAYYLIKIYRNEGWVFSPLQTAAEAEGEPAFEDVGPMTFNKWLEKNRKAVYGFLGWYVINTGIWLMIGSKPGNALDLNIFLNLFLFPINLIVLIVLAVRRSTREFASGILAALAVNFLISLFIGSVMNGFCFVPFIFPSG